MSFFAPILKANGHLADLHFTICVVGSRKVSQEDDYERSGWGLFAPNLTLYGFDADEEACQAANDHLATRQAQWTEQHFPLAIAQQSGTSTLYVTKHPMCSSLYPPNEPFLERFQGLPELVNLDFTVELETTTLDEVSQAENLQPIDFLQIDVQGADLQVLQGANHILQQGVCGIQIEVEFAPLYQDQPLFTDVDTFLRQQGFTLFDLSQTSRPRAIAPLSSPIRSGQLLWGEAFYLRDPIAGSGDGPPLQPDALLKLACVADVLGFTDYSAELLAYLTVEFGHLPRYNCADSIIIALTQIPNLLEEHSDQLPILQTIAPYLTRPMEDLIADRRSPVPEA